MPYHDITPNASSEHLSDLTPAIVWQHFATLCAIPRPSKHEARLREHLAEWAGQKGLWHSVDSAGNLLIRKPATPGHENAPSLAMQGHLDMVCQAKSGVAHDFLQAPIALSIHDGWCFAENTTLGADNGIGVALALAALEDDSLVHGPLEALFTVDEEAGMGGAHGLQPGWLQSTLMLNLDTEEWSEFYLGCAGGADVNVSAQWPTRSLPPQHNGWRLHVAGLRGGHSGCDIHRKRGNANRLLAEALHALDHALSGNLALASLQGGTARNALPREATAVIGFPAAQAPLVQRCLDALQTQWREALSDPLSAESDAHVTIQISPEQRPQDVLDKAAHTRLVEALCQSPYGVRALSQDFPGVVETSNNLGIVSLQQGKLDINLMVRSLRDSATKALSEDIAQVFKNADCSVVIDGHYPGWTPNPASPLLALCQNVFQNTFSSPSSVQVIHAGLECGIIGAKYPNLDIVSFGPTIRGAHAPGERVDIASVERCWTLLKAILVKVSEERK